MHFTGVDEEVQIPYALEYGIRVREATEHGQWELLGVEFDQEKKKAVITTYIVESYEYTLASQLPRQVTVFIEQRDPGAGEYFEMPPPDFTQAGHTRWAVALAPGVETLFTVRIRKVHERHQNVTEWNDKFIEEIRSAGLVSGANSDRLGRFVQERELAALASQKVQALEANYEQLVGRQEQLRMNLRALGDSGREVEIRNGVLDDLETSENRRRRLEQQIADLKEQIAKHERVQRTLVEEIYAAA